MKKLLGIVLGFEFIQNNLAKNAARAAAVAILALAAKHPWVAAILAGFGLTSDTVTSGLIAVAIALLGAIRGWTKPKPTVPPIPAPVADKTPADKDPYPSPRP